MTQTTADAGQTEHAEALIMVLCDDGWYVVTLPDWERVQGPYSDHADAVQAAETRHYRLARGWKP